MDISFRIRTSLSILLIVIGLISGVVSVLSNPWLMLVAGAMFVIAVILWVDDIRVHNLERDDFKKKIIPEALSIVDHIITSTNSSNIVYPVWSLSLKTDSLSDKDYKLWKQFYDAVEERNQYYRTRGGIGSWEVFEKFNRAIYENFFNVLNGILWVKEAIPEEDISNLVSRAEKSACV